MKTKFTKGNWILSKYSPTDFGVHSDEGRGNDIALVRGSDEEAEANAKLIAAAPEMLEALQKANVELAKFYAHTDRPDKVSEKTTCEVWQLVKDAITKATGGDQ